MKLEASNSREAGVALVITLILLSVITFMAITFLVVSRHASEAVTTVTAQVVAKQAADEALQQAQASVVASMLAKGEGFDFGLMVSTNYQSPFYDTTQPLGALNITNVNYADNTGTGLDYRTDNYRQMLNNLLVLPRPPVFITTNTGSPPDFRYYLDLNRNGVADPNNADSANPQSVAVDQFGNLENTVGDPEWIGILEHPDQPHSRSNQFVARYCFLAQPIGNSLDINYIHNQAKQLSPTFDGFLRNQGVGSWEINLAGFLNGLNPYLWSYGTYDTNTRAASGNSFSSTGSAFSDAAAILQYRYAGTFVNLASFRTLYFGEANSLLNSPNLDFIDYYSVGPLVTGVIAPAPLNNPFTEYNNGVNLGPAWSGADNPNHLFTPADYYTAIAAPVVTAPNAFTANLTKAGLDLASGDTNFNRYTFYRMLAQMGMESAPEPTNKLNLNYVNVGGYAATDFVAWADSPIFYPKGSSSTTNGALLFFTNAADRLLASQGTFVIPWNGGSASLSSGFIPVYPTNYYTPSVHRMLQLAANIYDAANPKPIVNPTDFDYPSVFRPTFGLTNIFGFTNIVINGYAEVGTDTSSNAPYNQPAYSLSQDLPTILGQIKAGNTNFNIYGIPWIIGAKKYLPNFNEVSMESYTALTRKVEIVKPSLSAARSTWQTNVQYVLGISNGVLVGAWNSYVETNFRPVRIGGTDTLITALTNQNGNIVTFPQTNVFGVGPGGGGILVTTWPGVPINLSSSTLSNSFVYPVYSSAAPLPPAVYSTNAAGFFTIVPGPLSSPIPPTTGYPLPTLGVNFTNRLRLVMVDQATGRVIDYVQLDGMTDQRDLTDAGELEGNDDWGPGGVWDTNRIPLNSSSANAPLWGIINQIQASQQDPPYNAAGYSTPVTANDWSTAVIFAEDFSSIDAAVTSFSAFYNKNTNVNSYLTMQVPFTPTRSVCVYHTWQVNDPLVHYTLPDLTDLIDVGWSPQTNWVVTNLVNAYLGQINKRYDPWGGTTLNGGNAAYNTNMALIDPLQTGSDAWQFPDAQFPNIGWLGRVHRGTPWQTVYMKSTPVDPTFWQNWTGNAVIFTNVNTVISDSTVTQPTNDWAIFDLFTTAPNANASRGQLSVNQTNYAAWAALLDGVIVQTNDPVNGMVPFAIDPNPYPNDPNGNQAALYYIVTNIAGTRSNITFNGGVTVPRPGGVFTRVGDILGTPALSVASPFLNPTNAGVLNDAAYEWLPQQIMSLLRVGQPRYVIYAYGQSLKPANNSIVPGGQFYGTCTNYQITGEVATRTVVRFEQIPPVTGSNPMNPTQNPVMPGTAVKPFRGVIESFTVLPPQ